MGQEMGSMFTARRRPSSPGRRWPVGCRRLLLLRFFGFFVVILNVCANHYANGLSGFYLYFLDNINFSIVSFITSFVPKR